MASSSSSDTPKPSSMADVYAASVNPMDFDAMLKKERDRKQKVGVQFALISPSLLYNDLQESESPFIIDIRTLSEYNTLHIRDAFHCNSISSLLSTVEGLQNGSVKLEAIQEAPEGVPDEPSASSSGQEGGAMSREEIRKAVAEAVTTSGQVKNLSTLIVYDFQSRSLNYSSPTGNLLVQIEQLNMFDKLFLVKEGFHAFSSLYPFLCISSQATMEQKVKARMRYPAEILQGKLYLGNFTNVCSRWQLQALGINAVLDLSEWGTKPSEGITHLSIPLKDHVDTQLPIKESIEWIAERLGIPVPSSSSTSSSSTSSSSTSSSASSSASSSSSSSSSSSASGVVLVHCLQGIALSPSIVIAFLMAHKKLPLQTATAYVMRRRKEIKPPHWAWQQLEDFSAVSSSFFDPHSSTSSSFHSSTSSLLASSGAYQQLAALLRGSTSSLGGPGSGIYMKRGSDRPSEDSDSDED